MESDDGSGIATTDTKSNNIFVVGPSAAGKTFSWKTLIPRLPTDYPSNYLSIDGGLMRDYSLVYEICVLSLADEPSGGSVPFFLLLRLKS